LNLTTVVSVESRKPHHNVTEPQPDELQHAVIQPTSGEYQHRGLTMLESHESHHDVTEPESDELHAVTESGSVEPHHRGLIILELCEPQQPDVTELESPKGCNNLIHMESSCEAENDVETCDMNATSLYTAMC